MSVEDVEGRAYKESDVAKRVEQVAGVQQEVMAQTPEGKAQNEARFERVKNVLSEKNVEIEYLSDE